VGRAPRLVQLAAIAVAATTSACWPESPSLDGTAFQCAAPDESCPDGFDCVDGTCRTSGAQLGPRAGVEFRCLYSLYQDDDERVAVLDALESASIAAVRIELGWDGIEDTAKGARNGGYLSTADFCVEEARRRGMAVIFTVFGTPGWASGDAGGNAPPDDPADFAGFLTWAAGHWAGEVEAWQIWVEPELDWAWTGTVDDYAELLGAAYPAVKAGDPDALVVLGAPSSNDDAWIEAVYDAGGGDAFDVLAVEPFQGVADAEPEARDMGSRHWFTHFPAVQEVMDAHGDASKPVWFTAFGWSAHDTEDGTPDEERGVTEEEQADYAVRAFELTAESYPSVTSMFWHHERTTPGDLDVHQNGFGMLRDDLSERPVVDALRDYLRAR
jgi:hypothetical protein